MYHLNMVNNTEQNMTQASAKTVVNDALKATGLKYISINLGQYKWKAIEPRTKGLSGGSIGPMTVTDAHLTFCNDTARRVLKVFQNLPADIDWSYVPKPAYHGNGKLEDLTFTITTGKNTVRVIKFCWELHQTYSYSQGYDNAYQTYWFAMHVEDKKVTDIVMA
jgi:hypothetical protein